MRDQLQKQAGPLLEMGVEVIPEGSLPMLIFSKEKDFTIGGATMLNGITVVAKAAEIVVKLPDSAEPSSAAARRSRKPRAKR